MYKYDFSADPTFSFLTDIAHHFHHGTDALGILAKMTKWENIPIELTGKNLTFPVSLRVSDIGITPSANHLSFKGHIYSSSEKRGPEVTGRFCIYGEPIGTLNKIEEE